MAAQRWWQMGWAIRIPEGRAGTGRDDSRLSGGSSLPNTAILTDRLRRPQIAKTLKSRTGSFAGAELPGQILVLAVVDSCCQ